MHHFLRPGETPANHPVEKLAAIIGEASGMPEIPVEVLSMSPWVMSPKISRKVRLGRIFFVGDSAARLSPAGGLGLNTGLQSTHDLAWKLAAVIQGAASPVLLDSYEKERLGATLWTLDHSNGNAADILGMVAAAAKQDWPEVRNLISQNGHRGYRPLGIDLGIEYPDGALIPDGTQPVLRQDPINNYIPNPDGNCPVSCIRANHLFI
jgi:putative polyketide hydroxylase